MKNILTTFDIDKIHATCELYRITNYSINVDGSIDVNGNVRITDSIIDILPISFNYVNGNFVIIYNKLNTLKGFPKIVTGDVNCQSNKLTSLEFCPSEIGGNFICSYNFITSLEYFPHLINGNFDCYNNSLPTAFLSLMQKIHINKRQIFYSYQRVLGIWDGGLNYDLAVDLVADIQDGLL